MLTETNYIKGQAINEQMKYNINFDKKPLFNIVCAGLASRLLNMTYAEELPAEKISILEALINK